LTIILAKSAEIRLLRFKEEKSVFSVRIIAVCSGGILTLKRSSKRQFIILLAQSAVKNLLLTATQNENIVLMNAT
jgi:hypothetical protein